jgi:hypothetical protein
VCDGFSMSKDPVSAENLANLRRTLPGIGMGDGSPVPLQEVSPSDVESALAEAARQSEANAKARQSLPPVLMHGVRSTNPAASLTPGASSPSIPMLRGASSPSIPMLRGASSPSIPMLRGASSPSIPMLRGASNPAIPMLRTTGTDHLARASDASIPSHPPPTNRLPLLIAGLGALALVIGSLAWLYPGSSTTQPKPARAGTASRRAVQTDGPQVAVPVRTVAPTTPVAVGVSSQDKPSSVEKTTHPPARKVTEATGSVGTTSKPQPTPSGPATVGPEKTVARKAEGKSPRAAALDLSPVPLLTPQILRQHMTVAEPKWQSCPKDGSGKNLSIGIVVAPSGSVVKADVLGPAGTTATARCVTERIRNMRFPAYAEGGPKTFFWSYQAP